MTNIQQIKYSVASFDKYLKEGYENSIESLKASAPTNTEAETKQLEYITNNFITVQTILKTYEPSSQIKNIISKLPPMDVYIIMENWCGSSANIVPYAVKMLNTIAETKIHVVPRDVNEDFMNLYLSDGKKSIPIIIGFDKTGNELFKWGSATSVQTEYSKHLQAQKMEFSDFILAMKKWFLEHNEEAIEGDFISVFNELLLKQNMNYQ